MADTDTPSTQPPEEEEPPQAVASSRVAAANEEKPAAKEGNGTSTRERLFTKSGEEDALAVASSPDGRFLKFPVEVGRGSFKTVFKGLDSETGVDVAWCELQPKRYSKAGIARFKDEAQMLKMLQHANILKFHDFFELTDKKQRVVVLVTELMTSGTLKTYLKRFKGEGVKPKVMKHWCVQILKGLKFLHSHTPPIIHRDLKCDNIFITGTTGLVKIGDLGMAILRHKSHAESVIGTPEFMAPEMYEEHYDESVDVYAFGMCLVEMATLEYPYKECSNAAQIYRKVTSGIMPLCLNKVENPVLKKLVNDCLKSEKNGRLTIFQLLRHDFFNDEVPTPVVRCNTSLKDEGVLGFHMELKDEKSEETTLIDFSFNLENDAPETVAKDMIHNQPEYLRPEHSKPIAKVIRQELRKVKEQKGQDPSSAMAHGTMVSQPSSENLALAATTVSSGSSIATASAAGTNLVTSTLSAGDVLAQPGSDTQPSPQQASKLQAEKAVISAKQEAGQEKDVPRSPEPVPASTGPASQPQPSAGDTATTAAPVGTNGKPSGTGSARPASVPVKTQAQATSAAITDVPTSTTHAAPGVASSTASLNRSSTLSTLEASQTAVNVTAAASIPRSSSISSVGAGGQGAGGKPRAKKGVKEVRPMKLIWQRLHDGILHCSLSNRGNQVDFQFSLTDDKPDDIAKSMVDSQLIVASTVGKLSKLLQGVIKEIVASHPKVASGEQTETIINPQADQNYPTDTDLGISPEQQPQQRKTSEPNTDVCLPEAAANTTVAASAPVVAPAASCTIAPSATSAASTAIATNNNGTAVAPSVAAAVCQSDNCSSTVPPFTRSISGVSMNSGSTSSYAAAVSSGYNTASMSSSSGATAASTLTTASVTSSGEIQAGTADDVTGEFEQVRNSSSSALATSGSDDNFKQQRSKFTVEDVFEDGSSPEPMVPGKQEANVAQSSAQTVTRPAASQTNSPVAERAQKKAHVIAETGQQASTSGEASQRSSCRSSPVSSTDQVLQAKRDSASSTPPSAERSINTSPIPLSAVSTFEPPAAVAYQSQPEAMLIVEGAISRFSVDDVDDEIASTISEGPIASLEELVHHSGDDHRQELPQPSNMAFEHSRRDVRNIETVANEVPPSLLGVRSLTGSQASFVSSSSSLGDASAQSNVQTGDSTILAAAAAVAKHVIARAPSIESGNEQASQRAVFDGTATCSVETGVRPAGSNAGGHITGVAAPAVIGGGGGEGGGVPVCLPNAQPQQQQAPLTSQLSGGSSDLVSPSHPEQIPQAMFSHGTTSQRSNVANTIITGSSSDRGGIPAISDSGGHMFDCNQSTASSTMNGRVDSGESIGHQLTVGSTASATQPYLPMSHFGAGGVGLHPASDQRHHTHTGNGAEPAHLSSGYGSQALAGTAAVAALGAPPAADVLPAGLARIGENARPGAGITADTISSLSFLIHDEKFVQISNRHRAEMRELKERQSRELHDFMTRRREEENPSVGLSTYSGGSSTPSDGQLARFGSAGSRPGHPLLSMSNSSIGKAPAGVPAAPVAPYQTHHRTASDEYVPDPAYLQQTAPVQPQQQQQPQQQPQQQQQQPPQQHQTGPVQKTSTVTQHQMHPGPTTVVPAQTVSATLPQQQQQHTNSAQGPQVAMHAASASQAHAQLMQDMVAQQQQHLNLMASKQFNQTGYQNSGHNTMPSQSAPSQQLQQQAHQPSQYSQQQQSGTQQQTHSNGHPLSQSTQHGHSEAETQSGAFPSPYLRHPSNQQQQQQQQHHHSGAARTSQDHASLSQPLRQQVLHQHVQQQQQHQQQQQQQQQQQAQLHQLQTQHQQHAGDSVPQTPGVPPYGGQVTPHAGTASVQSFNYQSHTANERVHQQQQQPHQPSSGLPASADPSVGHSGHFVPPHHGGSGPSSGRNPGQASMHQPLQNTSGGPLSVQQAYPSGSSQHPGQFPAQNHDQKSGAANSHLTMHANVPPHQQQHQQQQHHHQQLQQQQQQQQQQQPPLVAVPKYLGSSTESLSEPMQQSIMDPSYGKQVPSKAMQHPTIPMQQQHHQQQQPQHHHQQVHHPTQQQHQQPKQQGQQQLLHQAQQQQAVPTPSQHQISQQQQQQHMVQQQQPVNSAGQSGPQYANAGTYDPANNQMSVNNLEDLQALTYANVAANTMSNSRQQPASGPPSRPVSQMGGDMAAMKSLFVPVATTADGAISTAPDHHHNGGAAVSAMPSVGLPAAMGTTSGSQQRQISPPDLNSS